MGETDEKENPPAETPTAEIEEPKETEKLLNGVEAKAEADASNDVKSEKDEPTTADEAKPTEEAKKTNGEEIIDIPETKAAIEDGREVKPKKIPIGGLKLPGFFTRNKPKTENDGAEGELLDNAGNEAKAEEPPKEAAEPRPNFLASIKFRNPFAKKPTPPKEEGEGEAAEPKTGTATDDELEKDAEKPSAEEETVEAPPKRGLLNAIRLPIANIIPKRLRSATQQSEDVELGNGPDNKAGLASMETLDDSIKETDNSKDVTDKAVGVNDPSLETVKLNDNEKDAEKSKDNEKVGETPVDKRPILERIRSYHCSVDDLAIIGGIAVFLLLVVLICVFAFTGTPAIVSAPLRDGKFVEAITSCGKVEGVLDESAFVFRGIPFAVPPTGENRWKPAKLIENIDSCWNGTLKAHNATANCIQIRANGTIDGSEDCLHLDVVTPHVRYDNPLPVVVLISAESLTGDSPTKLLPSTRLCRERDVVFVRPNFRLGIFGFLALEALSQSVHPPSSGNYGLTDIISVLKWVNLNIEHFGGNKKAVTLVGHRAGATLVSALVTSPEARGLFARAWVSGSAASFPGKPLAESERDNLPFLEQSKCKDADCLRKADAKYLLETVPDTWRRVWPDLPTVDEDPTKRHQWLVLDGNVLRKHPNDAWNHPEQPKLVIGATAHESHSEKLLLKHKEWNADLVRQHIEESKIGQLNLTDEVLKLYEPTYKGLVSIVSDIRTICPLLVIAQMQPYAPFYVVNQTSGALDIASVDDDILAILGRYQSPTSTLRNYVSTIQRLFFDFVQLGELKQHEQQRRVLNVGADILSTETYPNCDFWIKKDVVPRYARLD